MRTIHKYPLTDVSTRVASYEGARFIHVDNQREVITVWAEVNTLAHETTRVFHLVGTGHVMPPATQHVGSALVADGDFVFHVYVEVGP